MRCSNRKQYTVNKKQLLIVLPFLGAQSFLVRKRLQSCIRNYLPYCSLRVPFQSKARISSLFRYEDIIPKEIISSHFVHKFMCGCCNATYYEESERHFFDMTPLTGKRVKNPKMSAIFDHILLKDHGASFEDFRVLLKENNKFKLHVKESL